MRTLLATPRLRCSKTSRGSIKGAVSLGDSILRGFDSCFQSFRDDESSSLTQSRFELFTIACSQAWLFAFSILAMLVVSHTPSTCRLTTITYEKSVQRKYIAIDVADVHHRRSVLCERHIPSKKAMLLTFYFSLFA